MKDNLIADPILVKMRLDLSENPDNPQRFRDDVLTYRFGDSRIMDKLKGNILIDIDPGFVDPENGNFQLKQDSPAYTFGFKRIPVEKIGLYVDEYRTSLPNQK